MRRISACALLVALCSTNTLLGSVVWDESINGDLSGNRLAPTSVPLAVGDNELVGSVKGGELDYLTFTIPAGAALSKVMLDSFVSSDSKAFIAIQHGSTFTEPAAGTVVANLLGYTHFGPGAGNVGTDILDDMGTGAGAQDFTPPLPAGAYSLWIQQLGALTSYQFDFVVSSVPEPSGVVLAGGALIASLCIVGRRRAGTRVQSLIAAAHTRAGASPAVCQVAGGSPAGRRAGAARR